MHETSFEVSRLEGDRWQTAGVFQHRNDALNTAKRLQRGAVVRVTQELLDSATGKFTSVVVYDSRKGLDQPSTRPAAATPVRSAKPRPPARRLGFVERVVAAVTGKPPNAA